MQLEGYIQLTCFYLIVGQFGVVFLLQVPYSFGNLKLNQKGKGSKYLKNYEKK